MVYSVGIGVSKYRLVGLFIQKSSRVSQLVVGLPLKDSSNENNKFDSFSTFSHSPMLEQMTNNSFSPYFLPSSRPVVCFVLLTTTCGFNPSWIERLSPEGINGLGGFVAVIVLDRVDGTFPFEK